MTCFGVFRQQRDVCCGFVHRRDPRARCCAYQRASGGGRVGGSCGQSPCEGVGSFRTSSVRFLRLAGAFAHRWPIEGELVCVMNQAVEDGVGEGGVAYHVVPCVDGQLAGDDGGLAAITFVDDLHQVAALRRGQLLGPPIVEIP